MKLWKMKRLFWRSDKYTLEHDPSKRNQSYDNFIDDTTWMESADFRPTDQDLDDLRPDDLELNDLGKMSRSSSDFDNNVIVNINDKLNSTLFNGVPRVKIENKKTNVAIPIGKLPRPKVKNNKKVKTKVMVKKELASSTGSLMIGARSRGVRVTMPPNMQTQQGAYDNQHYVDDETGSIVLDLQEQEEVGPPYQG